MTEVATEKFRVTSIPFQSYEWVIFTGVPIDENSYKVNSGKYFAAIMASPDSLPVFPSIGQHWSVRGNRVVKPVDFGDYTIQQHTYENPEWTECSLPQTQETFIKFIARDKAFKGIGDRKSRDIWETFGKYIYSLLYKDSEESRAKLSTVLTENQINNLFSGYKKYENLAYCNWLSEIKIPSSVQQRLFKYHDRNTINEIKSNPYVLVAFGMSFKAVDEIANEHFNIGAYDSRRLSSALEYALQKLVSKGHTYAEIEDVLPTLTKLLGSKPLVDLALDVGANKAQFVRDSERGYIHPTAQLLMESVIAKRFVSLSKKSELFDDTAFRELNAFVKSLPFDLAEKQIEAVEVSLDNGISLTTGGAGTGKTTVLNTTLSTFSNMGYEIHALALSGRAAMRLHESIGFTTKTVARFLREAPLIPSDEKPNHVLVIDEASMIDVPTMYQIVTHVHPDVRIILTGDPHQLPPIGCGRVLADCVESGVIAMTELDIVKRQSGSTGIPDYSMSVNAGLVPDNLSIGNIHFHHVESESLIVSTCTDLFSRKREASRVVAPTKELVKKINDSIQTAINPDGERMSFVLHGDKFYRNDVRCGDQILLTKNIHELSIQNGSLGTLTSVAYDIDKDLFGRITLDNGKAVDVTSVVMDCMMPGYSITLHKSQGSQFPSVIVALKKGAISNRAWIYTAITRAEFEVHIVGSEKDFRDMVISPSNASRRNSYLKDLLRKMSAEVVGTRGLAF